MNAPIRENSKSRSGKRARVRLVVAASIGLAGFACAWTKPAPVADPLEPAALSERIEQLRESIAGDHAQLEVLVSRPRSDEPLGLHQNPEIQAIADQLARDRAELARLEAQRRAASR